MGKAKKLGGLHEVIADNVRRLRKAKGLSQEALAEECGYHRTYVGGIERRERNITIATLEALAGALGVGKSAAKPRCHVGRAQPA